MSANNQLEKELALITVATKPDYYFKVMLQSCQRHKIHPLILGVGSPWYGFCTKLNLVYRYLIQSDSPPHALFFDGYDSIFQSGLTDIWKSYQSFQSSFVVAADMFSWPDYSLINKYPHSPTQYRFVNAGGFVGETKVLARALEAMGCPFKDESQNDQDKLAYYFLTHTQEVKIDYHAELFQTLCGAEDAVEFRVREGAYITRRSGKKPHIIHLNGVAKNNSYAKNLGYSLA